MVMVVWIQWQNKGLSLVRRRRRCGSARSQVGGSVNHDSVEVGGEIQQRVRWGNYNPDFQYCACSGVLAFNTIHV